MHAIDLKFPSKESATAYAVRQGLHYWIDEPRYFYLVLLFFILSLFSLSILSSSLSLHSSLSLFSLHLPLLLFFRESRPRKKVYADNFSYSPDKLRIVKTK